MAVPCNMPAQEQPNSKGKPDLGEARIINRCCIRRLVSRPIPDPAVPTLHGDHLCLGLALQDGWSQLELAHRQDVCLLTHLHCSLGQRDFELRTQEDLVQTLENSEARPISLL